MTHIVPHGQGIVIGFISAGNEALREMKPMASRIIRICVHLARNSPEPLVSCKLGDIVIEDLT